jgi:hypothetical protein
MTIREAIVAFTARLTAALEGQALEQARASVLGAFGLPTGRSPGRPLKSYPPIAKPQWLTSGLTTRKKAPLQLCPVPGCKNPAAPIFGMTCSKHKDVPKRLIKKYRDARRAKKLGVKAAKPARRVRVARKAAAPKAEAARKATPRKVAKAPTKVRARKAIPKKVAPSAPPVSAAAPAEPAATPPAT